MPPKTRPSVRQRRAARHLRAWRLATGATLDESARRLGWSEPKLSRYERAEVIAGPAEIIALALVHGISDSERDKVVALAIASAQDAGWWTQYDPEVIRGDIVDYIETEADADKVYNLETVLIPGLSQTSNYSRALFGGSDDGSSAEKSSLRQQRQRRLFTDREPLVLHAIVHETALTEETMGHSIMVDQLQHLIEMSNCDNITLQIVPFSCGPYRWFSLSYHVLSFENGQAEAVYLDTVHGGVYIEEHQDLVMYTDHFSYVSTIALSESASRDLLRRKLDVAQEGTRNNAEA